MAKTLWLLRHFEAVDDPPLGGRDRDRHLTLRGEAEAEDLGISVRRGELTDALPTFVLSSPATRTVASATLVFGSLEPAPTIERDRRLYRATPDEVLEILGEVPDEVSILGLVGHNPTVHCLCLDLVEEAGVPDGHPATRSYRPGTLSIITLPIETWSDASFAQGSLGAFRPPPRR